MGWNHQLDCKKRAQKLRSFWGFFWLDLNFSPHFCPQFFSFRLFFGFRTVFGYCGWDKNSPWISCWVPHDSPPLMGTFVRFSMVIWVTKRTCFWTIAMFLLCLRCCCEKSALISWPENLFRHIPWKVTVPSHFRSLGLRVFQSHPGVYYGVTFWNYGSSIHLWGSVHAVDGWFRNLEKKHLECFWNPCNSWDFNYRSLNWWVDPGFRTNHQQEQPGSHKLRPQHIWDEVYPSPKLNSEFAP